MIAKWNGCGNDYSGWINDWNGDILKEREIIYALHTIIIIAIETLIIIEDLLSIANNKIYIKQYTISTKID